MIAAVSGTLIAYVFYGTTVVNLAEVKKHLAGLHGFLANKWHFDELYDALFMKPAHVVGKFCAWVDKSLFDEVLHGAARSCVVVSRWDKTSMKM